MSYQAVNKDVVGDHAKCLAKFKVDDVQNTTILHQPSCFIIQDNRAQFTLDKTVLAFPSHLLVLLWAQKELLWAPIFFPRNWSETDQSAFPQIIFFACFVDGCNICYFLIIWDSQNLQDLSEETESSAKMPANLAPFHAFCRILDLYMSSFYRRSLIWSCCIIIGMPFALL